jgi:hypothetical protein
MKIRNFSEFITEALGIDKDIESQAQEIYKKIKHSNKNEFSFILYETSGNYFFKLIIGKFDKTASGRFIISDDNKEMTVLLKDRNDYSTLLHEMKHLSRAIKNKGSHFNDFIYKTHKLISNMDLKDKDPIKVQKQIFYVYDIDEFEAKYHGYYVDLDIYLKKIIDIKKQSPNDKSVSKDFIIDVIKGFLNTCDDMTYTWWVGYFNGEKVSKEFNFSNYLKESDINRLFYLITKKDFKPGYSYTDMFKEIYFDLKNILKTKMNIYSKEDKVLIQKYRKSFELEINKRKKVFSKKFYRLFSIMVDKYADS